MPDITFNQQIIHPLALAALLLAGILILVLPRKYALVPFFFAAVFIPVQQRILLFEIDFYSLRFLLTFALARVIARGEYAGYRVNILDATIIGAFVIRFLAYSILWTTPQAFLTALATAVDGIGIYLILRFLIRSFDDIVFTLKSLAILFLCLTPFIFHEYFTGENVFHIFGGDQFSWIREGNIRARGPFRHPLTLGALVTPFLVMFIFLFQQGKDKTDKIFAALGILSVTFICYSTRSSTTFGALFLSLLFVSCWPFRNHLKYIRHGFWGSLVMLQLYLYFFKNKPIWAILIKSPFFVSSNHFHRYHLFDNFVTRIDEWWLVGTKSSAHWWYFTYDQLIQFVWVGCSGGIFELIIFIFSLYLCFKIVGSNMDLFQNDKNMQFFFWTLGAALLTHLVSFWGVNYYDQSGIGLLLLFAIISATADLNMQISKSLFASLQKQPFGSAQGLP